MTMKKMTFFLILSLSIIHSYGQNHSDEIEIKKGMGTVFRQNGKNLTPKQLLAITQINEEAYQEMKIAKTNYDAGSVIGFAGGFLVGWPLGTAIAGGEPNWTLAGIGAGLIAIGIPFNAAYSKRARNAVSIYNSGLKPEAPDQLAFKLAFTRDGIGIRLTF